MIKKNIGYPVLYSNILMSSEKHLRFDLSTDINYLKSFMYYNRILRLWVLDPLGYFLLSAILGSIVASSLKEYLSEKKTMERLKNSIIKNSKLVRQSDRSISNFKKMKKIYKFALENRGGQFADSVSEDRTSDS